MTFSGAQRILFPFILIFSVLISCSQEPNQVVEVRTSQLSQLELDHQFTIYDSEEVIMQRVTGVNSDSEGRIFLTDQRALQIHVFDPQGNYLTSIGREGSGPGEFISLLKVYIDEKDQVFAADVNRARNTIFIENNNHWEPEQIFTIAGQRYWIDSADSDGNVVLRQSPPQYPEMGAFWYEHELAKGNLASGLIEQELLTIKDMGFLYSGDGPFQQIPFGRTTIVATDPHGSLYLVWNDKFEMAKYNAKMEFIDSLNVAIPNQPISNDEYREVMDHVRNNFRSLAREHMPDSKPVINNMFVDKNGNIWLQTFDSPEYLVLERGGTPLKSFDLDDEHRLVHVDEERIYTIKLDDEGYQIHILKYQL